MNIHIISATSPYSADLVKKKKSMTVLCVCASTESLTPRYIFWRDPIYRLEYWSRTGFIYRFARYMYIWFIRVKANVKEKSAKGWLRRSFFVRRHFIDARRTADPLTSAPVGPSSFILVFSFSLFTGVNHATRSSSLSLSTMVCVY